tara:strand:+ start:1456 stop:1641 length:186 start_codon:yes stop_codon:yes gene_type:complete
MNGATADPWLKTISAPKRNKTIIIGKSQYFFLSIKNSINSKKKFINRYLSLVLFILEINSN